MADFIFTRFDPVFDGPPAPQAIRDWRPECFVVKLIGSDHYMLVPDARHEPGGVSAITMVEVLSDGTVRECAHWVSDEWREAPEEVIGAVFGFMISPDSLLSE